MIFPIVSGLGVDPKGRELPRRISQERLEERGTHVLIAPASVGPNVVGEHTVGPAAVLPEKHCGRAGAPFFRTQRAVSRRRPGEHRTRAPNPAAARRRFGREEKTLHDVAQAELGTGAVRCPLRVDDRHDGARDEIPIFVERERNDRLDVGGVANRVGRTDAEVPVVLDGDLNEAGHRVLEFLGEFGGGGLVIARRVLRERRAGESEREGERGGDEVVFAGGFHRCRFQKSNSRLRPSASAGQGSKRRQRRVLERGEWPVNE